MEDRHWPELMEWRTSIFKGNYLNVLKTFKISNYKDLIMLDSYLNKLIQKLNRISSN
tara:strand:+ start:174 stop:344 length:171 start_codon:yes stop_codon:yes gene_type:complete